VGFKVGKKKGGIVSQITGDFNLVADKAGSVLESKFSDFLFWSGVDFIDFGLEHGMKVEPTGDVSTVGSVPRYFIYDLDTFLYLYDGMVE
jgi:hypothetical protein